MHEKVYGVEKEIDRGREEQAKDLRDRIANFQKSTD
jgi:hypothetical protein